MRVLLIEDDKADADHIREALDRARGETFEVEWVEHLSAGLARLDAGARDVVLLDLTLPDGQGLAALERVHARGGDVPVIVLAGAGDDAWADAAVEKGAQDCLVKAHLNGVLLTRAIRYAVERHRLQNRIRALSLTDDLTGLYNRRGFLLLARQQLKVAERSRAPLAVWFLDVDGMKRINDAFGHPEGDRTLVDIAAVLRRAFRASDIVARLHGDEFAVAMVAATRRSEPVVAARLLRHLHALNAERPRPGSVTLSWGCAVWDAWEPCSIEDLLARADHAMYRQKHARREAISA